MFLNDRWDHLISFQNAKVDLPPKLAGTLNSWNTTDRNLAMMGEFIRLRRPKVVLECGTFEGRTTAYIGNILSAVVENPILVSIDAGHVIANDDGVNVTYKEDDSDWMRVVKARDDRIAALHKIGNLAFFYCEGVVRDVLAGILSQYRVEFIYHDSCHVSSIQMQEWPTIEKYSQPGDIVCYDDAFLDVPGNFFNFLENFTNWHCKRNTAADVKQLWCEKR